MLATAGGGKEAPPVAVAGPVAGEFAFAEVMRTGEAIADPLKRFAERLAAEQAELLGVMVFGSLAARQQIDRAMDLALGERQWPVTWVEGTSCDGAPLAGIQGVAIRGQPVTRVRLGDRIVGSAYEDEGARYCHLGGLGPDGTGAGRREQARQTFANLESALNLAGFGLGDLIRTWFYNDSILDWYGDFNEVRSARYGGVKFRTGSMPASTGVAGRNPGGAALTLAGWAMQPLGAAAAAREIGSPLQCPAPAYGSSFSRAMEITSETRRRLLVSGTASIHPGGETAWEGNARKQVDLTMDVVDAILKSRGMGFGDVTRAIAYFKDPAVRPCFDDWCAGNEVRLPPFPSVHCDLCRDDLLFEIEVDAAKPR